MVKSAPRPRPAFQQLQYRFAAHLRDPARHKAPAGIEARRLKIYAELFYNNVQGFLASAFPVLRRITPDERWHALVREFFARHVSAQPLFHKIAAEFLRFLDGRRRKPGDWPFLRELAHYEWVELALSVDDTELPPARRGKLLEGRVRVSPLAWSMTYTYPVHRIGPNFLPKEPGAAPTHLIVWRNRADAVKFMEANAVTARLVELLKPGRLTGRAALRRIARELGHPQPTVVTQQGAAVLEDLRARDIILGTIPDRR
ncbi:MAG TPA: putative DNA-binding domain-containing protein [Verrucomicrobiae bacterium]|nr:putative DNA-binding domain-containing protein [Verrucomicrobiae bacterium]